MAGGQTDDAEKSQEATPQKLEKARRKGDIPRSADVGTAAAYLGLLVAALAFGQAALHKAGAGLQVFLAMPDRLAPALLGPGGRGVSAGILLGVLGAVAGFLLLPALFVLLSHLAQRSMVFAPDKLKPRASRISPLAGAKNKFGLSGLVEFAKTFVKMLAVSIMVGLYLRKLRDPLIGLVHTAAGPVAVQIARVAGDLLVMVTLFSVLIGGVDMIWQRFNHARKMRMSMQEMKDEHKESEGDPHTRAERRQRGRDIATNRMLLDVPGADVVVVNPTHYAVALKWSRTPGSAPVCVAKGTDEVAARIREAASLAGVPIHSDPPTARAIHASVEIGQEIRPDHYAAIAAALRFAEIMRRKARERRGL